MSTTSTDPGYKSPGQIENEVEQTRANVSGTLDALRGKLEPRQIVDQLVEQVSDYARGSGGAEFARNLGSAVRDNPLPLILIGAGIGWLMLGKGDGRSHQGSSMRHYDRPDDRGLGISGAVESGRQRISGAFGAAQEGLGQARDAVGGAASGASSMVSDVASRAADAGSAVVDTVSGAASEGLRKVRALGERASGAAEGIGSSVRATGSRVSSSARSAGETFGDLADAQPLLLGALGLALGAAVGAMLPRTETEDQLMGEARDTVATRLSDAASEGYEEIRSVAGEQVEQLKDAAAESYEKAKEHLDEKGIAGAGTALGVAASGVAEAVGGAVTNIASQAAKKADEVVPQGDRPPGR